MAFYPSDDLSQRVCHRGQSSQSVCPLMGAHSEGHLGGLTVPALFTFFPPSSLLLLQSQLSWPTMRENKEFLSVTGPSDMSQSHRENSHRLGSWSTNVETKQPPQRWRQNDHGWADLSVLWRQEAAQMWRFSKSVRCSVCLTRTQRGGTFLIDSFLALNQCASWNSRLKCAL